MLITSVFAYTAPSYDDVTITLSGTYTAPSYENIVIILDANATSDTCTCAGLNNNWEVDLSDNCTLSTACNLGTGTLNFTGTGNFYCNAALNTTGLGDPGSGGTLWVNSSCDMRVS